MNVPPQASAPPAPLKPQLDVLIDALAGMAGGWPEMHGVATRLSRAARHFRTELDRFTSALDAQQREDDEAREAIATLKKAFGIND